MLAIWSIVFLASVYVLVKAADYFTDYSEKLGGILKLPNFIIGVLIVAIGTSLPELATSIVGVSQGQTEFLSGNVLGTVIVNILLGLGIAIIIANKKAVFNWDIVSNDLPFFAGAIFLVAIALADGKFTFIEALIFLAGYVIYVVYAYYIQKAEKKKDKEQYDKQIKKEIKATKEEIEAREETFSEFVKTKKGRKSLIRIFGLLVASLIVVAVSSYFVVEAVINISIILGLGTTVIAATAVALGTSLPEILVATSAARRGNFDMVIGAILGSNIFDLFVIYGIVGLFTTLTISMNLFYILIPFLVGSFFLLWMTLIDKQITRSEAWMFILLYVMFVGKLLNIF